MALADRTFAEVAALLAAREPAPGGGSAAALTGALAAGLSEMVAGFAVGAGGGGPDAAGLDGARLARVRARTGELRAALLELADEDMRSYAPVLEALALDRGDPKRSERIGNALSAAAEVPLAIAAAAAEVAELSAEVAPAAGGQLSGDATAAVVLAEASARAAARLVEYNLAQSPDDERLIRVRELAQRAWAAGAALLV